MPPKTEAPKLFHKEHYKEVFYLLAVLIVIGAIVNQFIYALSSKSWFAVSWWDALANYLIWFWPFWKIIALILSFGAVIWATYSYLKLEQVNTEDEKLYGKSHSEDIFSELTENEPAEKENEKWKLVQEHVNSNNEANWRSAIIEADIMLEELLRKLGYQGDGVGEMLKGVDPTDMLTLNNAWEAHKVRNQIAHAGSGFQLSEREAKRVISLFETVFKEFDLI